MERPERPYSSAPPKWHRMQHAPKEIGSPPMGVTAENLANQYQISREEQDAFNVDIAKDGNSNGKRII